METKLKIGVIVASTRPNRNGKQIADWVRYTTDQDSSAKYTYLDLAQINLPFLSEPETPSKGHYTMDSTKAWAAQVAEQDGFLIITPEYNHGYPASLKNAIDTVYAEWAKKPVAYVGYGVMGAARSIEQLNNVLLQINMHPIVSAATNILIFEHVNDKGQFVPVEKHQKALDYTLNQLHDWADLLKKARLAQA